jgi:O-antigen/teichoic acid export membrane protein
MGSSSNNNNEVKFTKDVLWVGFSQIVILLFAFLTLPVLTKIYGPTIYGLWSQIFVTVGLLIPILNFQLLSATVRYIHEDRKNGVFGQSFSNMFWIIALTVFIALIIGITFRTQLSLILFKTDIYASYIILTFVWAGTGALLSLLLSYWRANGKITKLSIINIAISTFKFMPLILLALLHYELWYIIITQIAVEILFITVLFSSVSMKIGFKLPNTANLKKYLSFSVPQIPSAALLWIMDSSDRYFITSFLGLAQTGIYSASYGIGSLIYLFYFPISFVVFPMVTNLWEKGDISGVKKYLEYSTKIFLYLGIPGSAGLYVLSKPLLVILSTSEFAVGGGIITFLIALSTIFLGIYQINLYIIYLIEKTKFMPIIVGLSALVNIIINILLIPKIGIIGAAISTVLSYALLSLIVLIWANKSVGYNFDYVFISKTIFSSLIMLVVIEFIPVSNMFTIIIAILIGTAVYLALTLILKTFSDDFKQYIYGMISSFNFLKP